MTGLVVWTVIVIVALIAGLAFFLYWVGSLLTRIAGNLEEAFGTAAKIVGDAKLIGPGVEHINQTGGVVAGALPLLYGMAEEIVADVTYPSRCRTMGPGRRRSRPGLPRAAAGPGCTTRSVTLRSPSWGEWTGDPRSTPLSTPGRTAARCSPAGRWRSARG